MYKHQWDIFIIPKLRENLIPIDGPMKKKATFKCTEECRKSFKVIKEKNVCNNHRCCEYHEELKFLDYNVIQMACRRRLYQMQEGHWVVISYHSQKLPVVLRNYKVCELKGLVCIIHSFEPFLENNYF